ncbi:MAG: response regulator [Bacteroidota bacterium]
MKKILIIEDNEDIRENIAEILELDGFNSITAPDGKVGVEKAVSEHPDLIICDIMMPELDGYGVLHILGKKDETAGIPFIFLTAKAERSDMRKGMVLGADDYLTKPFEDTELLDAVESRLRKTEAFRKEFANSSSGLNSFISDAKKLHNLFALHDN